jgi:hypothetical protein
MTELSGQEATPPSQPGYTQPSDGSDVTTPDTAPDAGDAVPQTADEGDGPTTGTDGDTPDGEKPDWNVQTQGHLPEENAGAYNVIGEDQPQQ